MTLELLDITEDAYHADQIGDEPSLSRSIVHLLCTSSPAHARAAHPRLTDDPVKLESGAMDLGTAVHDLLLRGLDTAVVVEHDDWRTKAAKEQRAAARELGHVPLLTKEWQQAKAIVAAARDQIAQHEARPPLLQDGQAEKTITWRDHGVLCRARLDWVRDDLAAIDDVKTVGRSADPASFAKTIFSSGYDLQAAMYSRGVAFLTGQRPVFRFIAIEKTPPYGLSVMALAPDALALADRKLDYAISVWKRCLETGDWPGYPRRVCWTSAPAWAEMDWLDREAREETSA